MSETLLSSSLLCQKQTLFCLEKYKSMHGQKLIAFDFKIHLHREAPNCQVFHSERGHLYKFIALENYCCKRAYFYDARVLPNQHHLRASMQDDASSSGMPPPSSLGKNIGFIYLRSLLYQFIHYVINFYIK